MRRHLAVLLGLVILLLVNRSVWDKEQQLRDGRLVLLALAPVDPRSLMQGDYMRLRYAVETDAMSRLDLKAEPTQDGYLVVQLDKEGVATLQGISREKSRETSPDTAQLRFRLRHGIFKLASNAFFFQEGTAERYAKARFGEFRVGEDGELLLVGLRGERREKLELMR